METTVTKTTAERVTEVIAEQLGLAVPDIKPEAHFYTELGGDSLDHIEVTMTIEDEFGLEVADEVAEQLVTAQQWIDHLTSRIGA